YDPFRSKSTNVAKRKQSRVSNLRCELKRTHLVESLVLLDSPASTESSPASDVPVAQKALSRRTYGSSRCSEQRLGEREDDSVNPFVAKFRVERQGQAGGGNGFAYLQAAVAAAPEALECWLHVAG